MKQNLYRILLGMALFWGAASAVAQTSDSPLTITAVHTDQFPLVQVDFELGIQTNDPSAPATYVLSEDEQPSDLDTVTTTVQRDPVSLLIIIDQGLYSVSRYRQDYDPSELKQLFYTLSDSYLQDGDTVSLLTGRLDAGTNGRFKLQTHLEPTNDLTATVQAIDTLDLTLSDITIDSIQPIETASLLEPAIDRMIDAPNPVIFYLSALVHAPNEPGSNRAMRAAERLAADARNNNIRLYIFQAAADTATDAIRAPMQTLATNSDGGYVELQKKFSIDQVTAVYDTIWQSETTYTLTYRSAGGTADERNITLALAELPDQVASASYSVMPVQPEINQPTLETMGNSRYQLTASLTWPDGFPRDISQITIDGKNVNTFTLTDDKLEAEFDTTATTSIETTLTDELGLSHTVQIPLPDIVTPPPPLVPEAPTTTPPLPLDLTTLALRWLPWLGLGGVVIYILLARQSQSFQSGKIIQQTVRRLTTLVTGNEHQPVIAHLQVLAASDELVDETIDLINDITTLGRDPQLSDIQLYSEQERSSISGQHCTIQFDKGSFWISDNGSANGTTLNGRSVPPDDPHPLQDGDEIGLGDISRRGARLQFNIAQAVQRRQRITVADSNWQTAPAGKATLTDLEKTTPNTPQLPLMEDDETWWKKLE